MSRVFCLSLVVLSLVACGSQQGVENESSETQEEQEAGFFTPYVDSVCQEIEQVSAHAPSAEVHMKKDLSICRVKQLISEGDSSFAVFRFDETVGMYRPQEVGPFTDDETCETALEMLRPFFGTTICTKKAARKPFGY
jgi:hypothetical protein